MLISNEISIKIIPKNKKYYEDKLKKELKIGDDIIIDPNILPKYSKKEVIVKCNNCNTINTIMWKTYLRSNKNYYCSKCSSIKTKQTNIEKYGVENVFQIEGIKEKSKQTNIEKYGKPYYQNTEEFKDIISNKMKTYIKNNPIKKIQLMNNITNKMDKIKVTYQKKYSEVFSSNSIKIHGEKYDYSKSNYVNSSTKVDIICPIHGKFDQRPKDHIHNKQGCPKCKESKGEKEIRTFLERNGITYTYQKKFESCINKKLLIFDFYLPDNNICIEFDGEQHFKVVEKWGGSDGLKIRQQRDKIKTNYCKENDIRLIRIKYSESIEEKLKEALC
jgi:very-short-patch-repair endonuclease